MKKRDLHEKIKNQEERIERLRRTVVELEDRLNGVKIDTSRVKESIEMRELQEECGDEVVALAQDEPFSVSEKRVGTWHLTSSVLTSSPYSPSPSFSEVRERARWLRKLIDEKKVRLVKRRVKS